MSSKITQDILESYVFCKYKGYLQWTGEHGKLSDYAMFLTQSRDEVRRKAMAKMLAQHHQDHVVRGMLLTPFGFETRAARCAGSPCGRWALLPCPRRTQASAWCVDPGSVSLYPDAVC